MFESTAVLAHPSHKRLFVLPVSVAAHVLVVTAAVIASIWTVETPLAAPAQMGAFVLNVTPPMPPPPPPPKGRGAAEPAITPELPRQDTAPPMIPDAIPVLPAADEGPAAGDPNGVPGGVPGGTPGGVVNSVLSPPDDEPEPDPDVPMVPGGEVKPPVLISGGPPAYPRLAIQSRVEGIVVVSCTIDTSGVVRDARVVRSAHFLLGPPALDAVKSWRFKPGSFRGRSVSTIYELTVTFKLDRN
ncbi:MAG: energy transducer TonB [Thermoanaerobaculia bacterium]